MSLPGGAPEPDYMWKERAKNEAQQMFLPPGLLQMIEARAKSKNSWEGYAAILRYLQTAIQRVPTDLDAIDIDRLFMLEVHYLAVMLNNVFAEEGFEELTSYLDDPPV